MSRYVAILLALWGCDNPPAQEPTKTAPERADVNAVSNASMSQDEHVRRLLRKLGSEDVDVREDASRKLKALGDKGRQSLRSAAHDEAEDPEVRARAHDVLKAMFKPIQATRVAISELDQAISLFKLNHNRYPAELKDLISRPSDIEPASWVPGGYVKSIHLDGWGREFIYRIPGTKGQPFDLVSLGSDGRDGGAGSAADIWNHDAYKR